MNRSERTSRWHSLDAAGALRDLGTDPESGLDHADARARLAQHGVNDIETEKPRTVAAIVLAQFADLMILILIAAAIVSGFLGELGDTLVILIIVVLNAVVGATQEYRAQRAIAALRDMSALEARVIRAGRSISVPATEVVPGDIVKLEAGNIVPADLRLLRTHDLTVDESALTGESLPVEKLTDALDDADLPVGDRRNMAFKSTSVNKGRGTGVVVATGLSTEIGSIAKLLAHQTGTRTPLQQRLTVFGQRLALVVLAVCALIFVLGIVNGEEPVLMFLTAVSLAVAAVPEALPAVVTISLAIGAKKLSRENSLVRRLSAVESLGSVTYICADKTGTLTENRMSLAALFAGGRTHERLDEMDAPLRQPLGQALALCNEISETRTGEPTEAALSEAASAAGFDKPQLLASLPVIGELAFDTERKLMTTIHRTSTGATAFTKGAPEHVVERCSSALDAAGHPVRLDRAAVLAAADEFAGRGYRVLAVAVRELPRLPDAIASNEIETELSFVALVALHDPVREEAPQAIADCRSAGITPVMITGDHPVTARQIAARIGLGENADVVTGRELVELPDEILQERVGHAQVYARVDPAQKIRIVDALQKRGELVAMTGDGVNDAPALKQATIGVAMGKRGTDVARETAEMVLLDDNFATIVAAIREGRRVYDNIRKFIKYTMTSNTGEICVLLFAPFLGLPIPLLPIHILWVNLVTDGLPGLAFSAEPGERDIMSRSPRPPTQGVLADGMWQHMLWAGLMIAGLSLGTAAWADPANTAHWQTMVFTTLVTSQLFQALALRSERQSLLTIGLFTNRFMLGTVVATLAAQIAVIYVPVFNVLLHTAPLPARDLFVCLALGAAVLPIIELYKWALRRLTAASAVDRLGP